MLEFQFRPARDIAREEGENNAASARAIVRSNSWTPGQRIPSRCGKFEREEFERRDRESGDVCGVDSRLDLCSGRFGDDAGIRHARDFDTLESVCDLKLRPAGHHATPNRRRQRIDQGAVDVEKEKTLGNGGFRIEDCGLKSASGNLKSCNLQSAFPIAAVSRHRRPDTCMPATRSLSGARRSAAGRVTGTDSASRGFGSRRAAGRSSAKRLPKI